MLSALFGILMGVVFIKLGLFAFKMAWGMMKIVLYLVFLPCIILFTFFKGLLMIAWPLLIVVAIVSFIKTK